MNDVVFLGRQDGEFSEYRTPKEKCIEGQPVQRTWNHFSSEDERFFAGIWEAEPGRWKIDYTENEFCRILSGRSILRDADGGKTELQPGDELVIPAGFSGDWEVVEKTRKVYVIYEL